MAGILLGIICGAAECWLLRLLMDGVAQGAVKAWVIPAKMAVLVVFLVPCALIWPTQLPLAGISAGATLLAGSAATAFVFLRRCKKTIEPSAKRRGAGER